MESLIDSYMIENINAYKCVVLESLFENQIFVDEVLMIKKDDYNLVFNHLTTMSKGMDQWYLDGNYSQVQVCKNMIREYVKLLNVEHHFFSFEEISFIGVSLESDPGVV